MKFDSSQPIWQQLVADFTRRIIVEDWLPGEKVPSTRDLALEYQVNPNTVQRALTELDRVGMTHSERTSGRFVATDSSRVQTLRSQSATEVIDDAIAKLQAIGISCQDAAQLLQTRWEDHD